MHYIYHCVPQNLTGSVLKPLNTLQETLPEVYATHVQKYQDRAALFERQVPYLNCLWNDILHFSPADLEQIRDGLLQAGHQWTPQSWFKIDPVKVGCNQRNMVITTHDQKKRGISQQSEKISEHFRLKNLTIDV